MAIELRRPCDWPDHDTHSDCDGWVPATLSEVVEWLQEQGEVVEILAAVEHDQWAAWAQSIMDSEPITAERRERWQQYMVPYDQLPNDVKEHDRVWARRALAALGGDDV